MTSDRVVLGGVELTIADGWFDITADLPDGSPYSLAKADGFGVLQISSGNYRGGRRPRIGCEELKDILRDFGEANNLGTSSNLQEHVNKLSIVSGDFLKTGEFTRLWFISDGCSIAFATYVVLSNSPDASGRSELDEAYTIVHSISFAGA